MIFLIWKFLSFELLEKNSHFVFWRTNLCGYEFGPRASVRSLHATQFMGPRSEGRRTIQTAAVSSVGEMESRNPGFSPKGNVLMNILKSLHPIHIIDAFSKAETQTHVGTLWRKASYLGVWEMQCSFHFLDQRSFRGYLKLWGLRASPKLFCTVFMLFFPWLLISTTVFVVYISFARQHTYRTSLTYSYP